VSLSKEYIEGLVSNLEQEIGLIPVPKLFEVVLPFAVGAGGPEVPNPFTPVNNKIYLFQYLTADHVIQLPSSTGLDPGFCFEVWGINLQEFGAYRLEIHPVHADSVLISSECFLGNASVAGADRDLPFVMDGVGATFQGLRFVYTGIFDAPYIGVPPIGVWLMYRLDTWSTVAKTVDRATTAALPAFTADGWGPNRILTASGAGNLTVDGKTYDDILNHYRERILVKDEGDDDNNGVYRIIQQDPWKLRRCDVDQSDFQIDRRGSIYLVMEGTANANKQFWRRYYDTAITPVAGGGVGGLTDAVAKASQVTVAAVPGTFYSCYNDAPNDLGFTIPTASATHKGKEIGFKKAGSWLLYKVNLTGAAIDGSSPYVLPTEIEWAVIRCVETSTPGVYEWVLAGADNYRTIQQNGGSFFAQRRLLNIIGGKVVDNVGQNRTDVTVGVGTDYVLDSTGSTSNANWTTIGSVTVPGTPDRQFTARLTVWGRQTSGSPGSVGDAVKIVIEATFQMSASLLTFEDELEVYKYSDDPNWDTRFTYVGSSLNVQVKGGSTQNINWRCQLEVSERA
jgi:hypothetical protein